MAYTIHYNGQKIKVEDYDTDWLIPDRPRHIEVKDTDGLFHCLALGPGIPILVSQDQSNNVYVM